MNKFGINYNRIVNDASEIVRIGHINQVRETGEAYFNHCMEVRSIVRMKIANIVDNKNEAAMYDIISIAHDLQEDNSEYYYSEFVPFLEKHADVFDIDVIINSIDVLSRDKSVSYLSYIKLIKEYNLFCKITKIADLTHNIACSPGKYTSRKDKYILAKYILEN